MPHIHVPEVLSFNGQEQTTREQEGGGGQNSRLFRHIHAMQADEKQRYTHNVHACTRISQWRVYEQTEMCQFAV